MDLKVKITDVCKAQECYKNTSKRFQILISTIWNVIEKWYLKRALKVKISELWNEQKDDAAICLCSIETGSMDKSSGENLNYDPVAKSFSL